MADEMDLSEVAFFKLCWGHGESRKTYLGRKYEVLIGRESKLQEVDVKLSTCATPTAGSKAGKRADGRGLSSFRRR